MSILALATLGGLISFTSTSIGALGSFFSSRSQKSFRWKLSIDFALGLMVSASAFTLIGPIAVQNSKSLFTIAISVFAGALFVFVMKKTLENIPQGKHVFKANHLLLAAVLMLHNFPEGLASGAALAGLGWSSAMPILGGISLQNIPEGALMVFCLRAMGWSHRKAFLGGLGSGLVEMIGALLAGVLMGTTQNLLPMMLSFAGGAMMASVLAELSEGEQPLLRRVVSAQFLIGFLCLPLLQAFAG